MAVEVNELDGRTWGDTTSGGSITRRFRITGLAVGFTPAMSYIGLPSIGDAHPAFANYTAKSRNFTEGQGSEKQTVTVEVNYEPTVAEAGGSGETAYEGKVDEWGWDGSTEERELTTAADGTPVLNSAGDVFNSVPSVSVPAPVFTKVMKFSSRKSGALAHNCKVNATEITIGDKACPARSLLCTISEKRLFNDAKYRYVYTIQLKFRSNPVKVAGAQAVTDIGWDTAITDAGMREKASNGELVLIKQIDKETGKVCTVSSEELLNGQGKAVTRQAGQAVQPYNIQFQAYETTTFPSWFYSEPQ